MVRPPLRVAAARALLESGCRLATGGQSSDAVINKQLSTA